VSKQYLASDGQGFRVDWNVQGFNLHSGNIIYQNYRGVVFPDTITISIINSNSNLFLNKKLVLYKVE